MKKEKNAMRDNLHEQKEPLKIKGNIRKKKQSVVTLMLMRIYKKKGKTAMHDNLDDKQKHHL